MWVIAGRQSPTFFFLLSFFLLSGPFRLFPIPYPGVSGGHTFPHMPEHGSPGPFRKGYSGFRYGSPDHLFFVDAYCDGERLPPTLVPPHSGSSGRSFSHLFRSRCPLPPGRKLPGIGWSSHIQIIFGCRRRSRGRLQISWQGCPCRRGRRGASRAGDDTTVELCADLFLHEAFFPAKVCRAHARNLTRS